jgi:hypothetical protein
MTGMGVAAMTVSRYWWFGLLIVLMAFSGCRSEGDIATLTASASDPPPATIELPTPTPEMAGNRFPDFPGFERLNANPFLAGVVIERNRVDVTHAFTEQAVPSGYTIYNNPINADGFSGAEHGATLVPIIERQQGLVFDLGGRSGEVGLVVVFEIDGISRFNPEPICLFAQWGAGYAIDDSG